MKNKTIFINILVSGLLEVTLLSGFTVNKVNQAEIHQKVSELPDGFSDFAGKWLAYKVEILDEVALKNNEPGIHLEINETIFQVEGSTCNKPVYSIREISQNDFLRGKTKPEGSIEFYEDHFKYLESGCEDVKPAAVALLNSRTLAAIVGSDLIFFEADHSVTEGEHVLLSTMLAETSKKPLLEAHGQIPVIQNEKGAKFNQAARSIVLHELTEFRQGFEEYELPPEMAKYRSFMWIGYDVPLLTDELISIRFSVDYMMAGAAHPGHHFRVLNYDLKHDEPISPDESLMNSSLMLKLLSDACLKRLNKPDFPLFPEGLDPKYENFENWNLTKNGLRVSFAPCMVAPCASGPLEVIIPYAEIKDQIRSSTTVGAFVAQY